MKAKKIGIVLIFVALAFTFGTSCEQEECDKDCRIYMNFMTLTHLIDWRTPCRTDILIGSGGFYRTAVPEPPGIFAKTVSRCFIAPETLTITPSAGITIQLYRMVPPFCQKGELLGENSAPGEALVYFREGICWEVQDEALLVKAYGAAGTLGFEVQ